MKLFHLSKSFPAISAFAIAFSSLLTGCGTNQPLTADPQPGSELHGVVFGGQAPISGAHIYLMAANTATFMGPSTSLLTTGSGSDSVGFYVLTGSDGSFSVSGDYTCAANTQVYLLAMGGNPGMSPAIYNTAATMVALLGNCPAGKTFAGVIPYIVVNEVSTVAAAYSVAGFALDYKDIGAPSGTVNQTGLANAFLTAGNMVSLGYGDAYTTTPAVSGYGSGRSANGVVPQAKIYSLANSLAACVNSANSATTTSTACGELFSYTPNKAGVPSTDVFDAALNLAHSPGIITTPPAMATPNAQLYALAVRNSPFYPALSTAPNDWAISIKFSSPNSSYPARPAVDLSGDVWIPNPGNNTLTELGSTGLVLSGTTGFSGGGLNGPSAVGVDLTTTNGAVWVSNLNAGTVSKFNSSGTPASTTGYTTLNAGSYDLVMDGSGPVVPGAAAVSILLSTGTVQSADTQQTVNTSATVDPSTNVWSAQYEANTITKLNSGGTTGTAYLGGGLDNPTSMAADTAGDIWVANGSASRISEFAPSGTPVSTTGYSGGGILNPYSLRIDGGGQIFVGNTNGSISSFSTGTVTGSPAAGTELSGNGYITASTASYLLNPTGTALGIAPEYAVAGLAIDESGNLWAPDLDGSLYEFVGLAVPVVP